MLSSRPRPRIRRTAVPVLASAALAAGLLAAGPAVASPGGPNAAPVIDPVVLSADGAALSLAPVGTLATSGSGGQFWV